MAVFDPREQRMCVRIVYDGLAGAGKTTNVRQLSSLFTAQRTTVAYSPAEIDGRTLYFDWMQIYGGVVCGFPLLCQVISVPGQVVLTERRRHLLSTADAVVYVCDSASAVLGFARDGLGILDDVCRGRSEPPTLVIQANKQDQAEAVAAPALLERIGREGVPCVEAIARDGIGVVDTFIAAVRTVARSLQQKLEEHGSFRVPVMVPEGPKAMLARLEALEVDPEWAAEMFLEEAASAYLAMGSIDAAPLPEGAPGPRVDERSAPFPRPDVPTGFVWPAHTGRARLRSLADDARATVPLDESGGASTTTGGFCLATSRHAHFTDADSAKQAIVRAARERTQLESLLAPDTVIVLQPANSEESWLWTITPALPPVRAWLDESASDVERRARLETFAIAISDALSYAMRYGLALDTSTNGFGVDAGALRYLGELVPAGQDTLSRMVETVLREVSAWPDEVGLFVETLERALQRRSLATADGEVDAAESPVDAPGDRVLRALTRERSANAARALRADSGGGGAG